MSAKPGDKKNRILHSGESQTEDGRYKYTFYEGGKQRAFYSWKLEPTDRLPAGRWKIEVQDMQGDASLCRISMKSKVAQTRIK